MFLSPLLLHEHLPTTLKKNITLEFWKKYTNIALENWKFWLRLRLEKWKTSIYIVKLTVNS